VNGGRLNEKKILFLLFLVLLTGCSSNNEDLSKLRAIQNEMVKQQDELKAQGIVVYSTYVNHDNHQVIVEVENITNEQRGRLRSKYGLNNIDFVKGQKVNPSASQTILYGVGKT
jgi:hypothetical protein